MRSLLITACSCLFCIAFGAFGESPKAPVRPSVNKAGTNQPAAKPKDDQRPAQIVAPLFITASHPPEPAKGSAERPQQESQPREDWATHFIRFTATDFAIALFTGLLCVFAYRQLRSAIIAANAAKTAADIAEDTMVSQQRPWLVVVKAGRSGQAHRRSGSVNFDVTVKNVGASPAMNVFIHSERIKQADWPSHEIINDTVQRHWPRGKPPTGIVIVPDNSKDIPGSCMLSLDQHRNGGHYLDLMLCCAYYSFPFSGIETGGYYATLFRAIDATPDDSGYVIVEFDERATYAG